MHGDQEIPGRRPLRRGVLLAFVPLACALVAASVAQWNYARAVHADIERITFLWRDCRKRFSGAFQKDEGFLFGAFGAADAMFAPVATRFKTYNVTLDNDADAYCKAVLAHPAMKEWIDAAEHEPWLIDKYEFK